MAIALSAGLCPIAFGKERSPSLLYSLTFNITNMAHSPIDELFGDNKMASCTEEEAEEYYCWNCDCEIFYLAEVTDPESDKFDEPCCPRCGSTAVSYPSK